MKLRVKIKRLKDVELPKYAKPGDSGFDLVAAADNYMAWRNKGCTNGIGVRNPTRI